jgi:XTP/dITP diphosphohydrolase
VAQPVACVLFPRLVVATGNPGKLRELGQLLAGLALELVPQSTLGVPAAAETGATFAANALLKARHAARHARLPALADDSGLVVPALGGAPGIYSARWAGPAKDFQVAMERVHRDLGNKDRNARFVAVLALAWPGDRAELFRGEVEGILTWPPRGDRGFGYDPMFIPLGGNLTFGEIDPEEKHRVSHRARAFAKLVERYFGAR